jgi:hypothetical protein
MTNLKSSLQILSLALRLPELMLVRFHLLVPFHHCFFQPGNVLSAFLQSHSKVVSVPLYIRVTLRLNELP